MAAAPATEWLSSFSEPLRTAWKLVIDDRGVDAAVALRDALAAPPFPGEDFDYWLAKLADAGQLLRDADKGEWSRLLERVQAAPVWDELTDREEELLRVGLLTFGPVMFPSRKKWLAAARAWRKRNGIGHTRGLSPRTFDDVMTGLVNKGVLERERRTDEYGRRTTTRYTLSERFLR